MWLATFFFFFQALANRSVQVQLVLQFKSIINCVSLKLWIFFRVCVAESLMQLQFLISEVFLADLTWMEIN